MKTKLLLTWLALAALGTTASGAAPATPPATGPATRAAATQVGKLDFPAWAMKAYPDDIVRLMRFDRVKEAEALGTAKLAELEKAPAKTIDYIQTVNSMCHLYLALNRMADAQKVLEAGQKRLKDADLSKRDANVSEIQLLDAQSAIAAERGDTDRAIEYEAKALDIGGRLLQLPQTDLRLTDVAMTYSELAMHGAGVAGALSNLNRGLRVYTQQLGANSAPVADVNMTLGYLYLNAVEEAPQQEVPGLMTRAETSFQQALTIRKAIYGENSEVGNSLMALAEIDMLKKQDADALTLLRQARGMTVKVIGENDPDVAHIDLLTASAIDHTNGNADEAGKLCLKAIAVLEKYPETRSALADALDQLAEHYAGAKREDLADDARERAEKVRAELRKRQEL